MTPLVGLILLSIVGPLPICSLDLSELIEEAPELGLSTFVSLVNQAELTDVLTNYDGQLTIFPPSDEAFEKIPEEMLQQIASDKQGLQDLLLSHVTAGKVLSDDLSNELVVPSLLEGAPIRANVYLKSKFYPGFATINGKRISKKDLEIVGQDMGVVHVLADVMYPIAMKSILENLEQDEEGRFSTLLTALEVADLLETLESEGPFTVFAPTNEAFARIPSADLDSLLADPDALAGVLLRHVVPGTFFQKGITWKIHDAAGGEQIQTQVFKGGVVKVVNEEGGGAKITEQEMVATNGVVQVINHVI